MTSFEYKQALKMRINDFDFVNKTLFQVYALRYLATIDPLEKSYSERRLLSTTEYFAHDVSELLKIRDLHTYEKYSIEHPFDLKDYPLKSDDPDTIIRDESKAIDSMINDLSDEYIKIALRKEMFMVDFVDHIRLLYFRLKRLHDKIEAS